MSVYGRPIAMPKLITQYSVFIGSPGGLETERALFRKEIDKYSLIHSKPFDVLFRPVGWEETVGGVGRAQAVINEDLKACDYAVFVLHDRWGTPTGSGHTSGTEEEWDLAEQLYEAGSLNNIVLLFKDVDRTKLADPGPQLEAVLRFRKKIETGRKYLFKTFASLDSFGIELERCLAQWLKLHHDMGSKAASDSLAIAPAPTKAEPEATPAPAVLPGFDYWFSECGKLANTEIPDYNGALFCAQKAVSCSATDSQWMMATNSVGSSLYFLNMHHDAIQSFSSIINRYSTSSDAEHHSWVAIAQVNKGVSLSTLGRSEEAIAVYDGVIARYATATEPALREPLAKTLVNKGITLGALGRSEEEIAVYNDLIARYGTATEPALREQVAKALVNKGGRLSQIGRSEEAIATCDDIIARYATATEPALREQVAKALGNKAWGSYLAGDDTRYLELTDRALVILPNYNVCLANRAFALHLLGRSETEVTDAYAQALRATPDRQKWYTIAIEDLEKHSERHPGAPPIAADFITAIAALGRDLPNRA
jgi:tetratricopeptide (TPR) repeat protein